MSTLQEWALGAQAFTAVYQVAYHYLVLHGWGDRLAAWYHGRPGPVLTAHANWERNWTRRTSLQVYALGLASVLMLAAAWQYSVNTGIAVTCVAQTAAWIFMWRAARRAGRTERQAHGRV